MYAVPGTPPGSYFTRVEPASAAEATENLALDATFGNSGAFVSKVKVPVGTPIYEGTAAAQGTLRGGGSQVYIPREWLPGVKFGAAKPLH